MSKRFHATLKELMNILNMIPWDLRLETVPILYVGPYTPEIARSHRDGPSQIGNEPIREGCVIKTVKETKCAVGRKILKSVSDAYLLKQDNTENH
jgi:hypothetical protein